MFRGSFSHSNLLFLLLQTAVLSVRSQAALPLPQCACPSRTGRCGHRAPPGTAGTVGKRPECTYSVTQVRWEMILMCAGHFIGNEGTHLSGITRYI